MIDGKFILGVLLLNDLDERLHIKRVERPVIREGGQFMSNLELNINR